MRTFADRLVSSATLDESETWGSVGEALARTGQVTLATMARNPKTISAVNLCREQVGAAGDTLPGGAKDRLQELNRGAHRMMNPTKPTEEERKAVNEVWDTLPGYTCFIDALAIAARL